MTTNNPIEINKEATQVTKANYQILNGNELIIQGALEAGYSLYTGYPGSPLADYFNILHKKKKDLESKGIQVVLSSLYDGPVGIAALLHLAVALGLTESAQGLNTLALCTPHPCRVLKPGRDGRIAVPEGAGLGLDRPWAP